MTLPTFLLIIGFAGTPSPTTDEAGLRAGRMRQIQQVAAVQTHAPTYTPMTPSDRAALERACRRFAAQHQGKIVNLRDTISEQRSETGSK